MLPYLCKEKSAENEYTKRNTATYICIIVREKLIFPDIKDFNIHAKRKTEVKIIKSACLLYSRTFEVKGRKKRGKRKNRRYNDPFNIKSYDFIADSFISLSISD